MRYILILIVTFLPFFVQFESFDYLTHVYVLGIMLMINELISAIYNSSEDRFL